MINAGQLVNGLWVGTVLIAIALIPGLFDRFTRAVSDVGNAFLFRTPSPARPRFSLRPPGRIHAMTVPWLAALGMAIVLFSAYAYIAQ